MAQQLRLSLKGAVERSRDAFVAGPSNQAALDILDSWPAWHGGALVLFGPQGSGKSHLAVAWAKAAGAAILDRESPDLDLAAKGPVLLEDVDRGAPAEALFHLINLAARPGGGLLMTARRPPSGWPAELPDLRSRLNALLAAEIEPPDDAVLEGVLRRFFKERHIRPPEAVYPYLMRRIERSIPDAAEMVRRLDEAGDDAWKPVTRALARQILEADDEA